MFTFKVTATGKDFAHAVKLVKKKGSARFNQLTSCWEVDATAASFLRQFPEYVREVGEQSPNFTDNGDLRDHA